MSNTKRRLGTFVALSVLFSGVACAEPPKDSVESSAPRARIAAVVDGTPITMQEVDEKALADNMKLSQQLYDVRRNALDLIIMERLVGEKAAAQNLTVEQFLEQELSSKVAVTDADVEKFFNENQNRMGGRTLEQMSGQITQFLMGQKANDVKSAYVDELMIKAAVDIKLEVPRVEIMVASTEPHRGPPEAKVTIVEYSDFQ